MIRHAEQRLLLAVPVLFGVLLIGFLLMQVVPTDPATVRAGPQATAEVVAAIRTELGLDEPIWKQFFLYVWRLAVGAILSAAFPMAQGTIIVLSAGFILINLVVDLLYGALDPRVRA